ncbi:rho gtpase activation protein [Anaeramoeba flamelloides]|uniref:Rho gtpase activation protein n=1 Tax=Anaeramoeba flamelloides TaxID=1746091 RepID=A0ABQ8YFC5_9EUKA|nr:rho gtpase activation protein [Anaeramoeba flamelloides]
MSQSSTKPKKLLKSSKLKESKIKKLPSEQSAGEKKLKKSQKKKSLQTPKKNAKKNNKKKKNRIKKVNKKKFSKQKRKSRRGRKRSLSQELLPIPQLETENEKRSKKKKEKKTRKRIKKKKTRKKETQNHSNTHTNPNQNQNPTPNGDQKKNTKQPLGTIKPIQKSNSYNGTKNEKRQNNKKMNKYGLIQKKKFRKKQKKRLFRGFSMDFKHYRKNKKHQNPNGRQFSVRKEKEFVEFLNQKSHKKIRDFKSESKSEYNIYPILNSIDLNEYAKKNFSPKKKRLLRRKNKPHHSQLIYSPQKLQSPILKFDQVKDSKLAVDLFEYLLYFMGEKKYVKKFKRKSPTSLSNTTNISTATQKTKKKMKTATTTAAAAITTTQTPTNTKQKNKTEGVTNNTNTNNKTNSRQLPIKPNKQFEQNDAIKKIIKVGLTNKNLRDEIYIQICKQTTNNPNLHSNLRAWGALCLVTQSFPPSEKLSSVMIQLFESYNQSQDKFIRRYARYAQIKLESILPKKSGFLIPTDEMIRRIFAVPYDPIIFNVTLEDCMISQKKFYPNEIIPYIIIYLIKKIKQTGGLTKEGLFRVPGNT